MNQSHILLVDEHDVDRSRLRERLNGFYHIREATDGDSAVELCRTCHPKCIVLDLRFTNEVGMDVLIRLLDKATDGKAAESKATVMVWTGLMWNVLEKACLSLGVSGYYLKHRNEIDELVKAIERVLGQDSAHDNTVQLNLNHIGTSQSTRFLLKRECHL